MVPPQQHHPSTRCGSNESRALPTTNGEDPVPEDFEEYEMCEITEDSAVINVYAHPDLDVRQLSTAATLGLSVYDSSPICERPSTPFPAFLDQLNADDELDLSGWDDDSVIERSSSVFPGIHHQSSTDNILVASFHDRTPVHERPSTPFPRFHAHTSTEDIPRCDDDLLNAAPGTPSNAAKTKKNLPKSDFESDDDVSKRVGRKISTPRYELMTPMSTKTFRDSLIASVSKLPKQFKHQPGSGKMSGSSANSSSKSNTSPFHPLCSAVADMTDDPFGITYVRTNDQPAFSVRGRSPTRFDHATNSKADTATLKSALKPALKHKSSGLSTTSKIKSRRKTLATDYSGRYVNGKNTVARYGRVRYFQEETVDPPLRSVSEPYHHYHQMRRKVSSKWRHIKSRWAKISPVTYPWVSRAPKQEPPLEGPKWRICQLDDPSKWVTSRYPLIPEREWCTADIVALPGEKMVLIASVRDQLGFWGGKFVFPPTREPIGYTILPKDRLDYWLPDVAKIYRVPARLVMSTQGQKSRQLYDLASLERDDPRFNKTIPYGMSKRGYPDYRGQYTKEFILRGKCDGTEGENFDITLIPLKQKYAKEMHTVRARSAEYNRGHEDAWEHFMARKRIPGAVARALSAPPRGELKYKWDYSKQPWWASQVEMRDRQSVRWKWDYWNVTFYIALIVLLGGPTGLVFMCIYGLPATSARSSAFTVSSNTTSISAYRGSAHHTATAAPGPASAVDILVETNSATPDMLPTMASLVAISPGATMSTWVLVQAEPTTLLSVVKKTQVKAEKTASSDAQV